MDWRDTILQMVVFAIVGGAAVWGGTSFIWWELWLPEPGWLWARAAIVFGVVSVAVLHFLEEMSQ